jgi:ribosomal protein L20A (L18A)
MKIYEITFSFMDPSKAMGTIAANSPEEAVEKIKADIAENSPGIEDFKVISIKEVAEVPEELSPARTLN